MKKNGAKPEKKKTPSYEEGKVRGLAVKKMQERERPLTRDLFLGLIKKSGTPKV